MSRTMMHRAILSTISAACAALLAAPEGHAAYRFDSTEAQFDATYAATPINLTGTILDEAGVPIEGAQVTTIGWGAGAANDGEFALTDGAGAFTLPSLARRSVLLRVEADGYHTEIIPADLHRPLREGLTSVGQVVLSEARPGRARLIFAGDTMFGRRFIDSDDDGIEGETGDLIRPGTRAADADALLTFLRDVLASADYTQLNLECPVTSNPSTPHPYKRYTFFSYPETIGALTRAGVDGVSLGNNHVYDYLESGITDTLAEVPRAGLDWFGAGMSETLAKGSVLYRTIGGVDVAFQGFSALINDGTTLAAYKLVASDGPPAKGGALELGTPEITDFLTDDAVGHFGIPVLHGGTEYSDYPTTVMRDRFTQLIRLGAGLVVAHHPHAVHGVGLYDAGAGPRYVFMSLGNMIFDQDIFKTFQSYLASVDVDQTGPGTYSVHRVQLIPFHIESYVPTLVSGAWLARAARHVGHLSTTLPEARAPGAAPDGLVGAVVFPAGPRIVVASSPSQYTTAESNETLTLALASGTTVPIEFARQTDADFLGGIRTSAPASCEYGRETMLYGDFEDNDVDDTFHESTKWPASTVRYLENSTVRSGNGAAVLLRKYNSTSSTSTSMAHRVPFAAGRNLTLLGYVKGDNAGPMQVQLYWYNSAGTVVSSPIAWTRAAGTYDWQRFVLNLTPPSGAASIRLYFRAGNPSAGEATTFLDDISLVEWEGTINDASTGTSLATPNNWSFLRCRATDPARTTLGVTMTHKRYGLATTTP